LPQHNEIKSWLQSKLSRELKLLILLNLSAEPAKPAQLKRLAREYGLTISDSWNISRTLARSDGRAVNAPNGWEITPSGKVYLAESGINFDDAGVTELATDLRKIAQAVSDPQSRDFLEECIKCFEYGLLRAAIVMSWLAAVDQLQNYVVINKLKEFNAEAKAVNAKWKPATTRDDLGRMKESDFLDRLAAISVIGKNTKKELLNCLDRRNASGHPNSLKLGNKTVEHHLEILILNVFQKFSV
tara:strand:- start:262 stop:990 length:729 start_codon:yes stop_codon:yes gene_type:complete